MAYEKLMLNQLAAKEFDVWETGYTGDTYRIVIETFDEDGEPSGDMEPITGHFSSCDDCYEFYGELVYDDGWHRQDLREIIQREVHGRKAQVRIYVETEWFENGESVGSDTDICAKLQLYWRNGRPVVQWKRSWF